MLDEQFETAFNVQRGWRDKGEQQKRFIIASTFFDERFNMNGKAFRTYYVCMAGGNMNRCGTAILSAKWRRLKEDKTATGQRYYCMVCGSRYKTSNGVLIEMKINKKCFYTLADIPHTGIEDLRSMIIESRFGKKARTPEELLEFAGNPIPFDDGVFLTPLAQDQTTITKHSKYPLQKNRKRDMLRNAGK